MKEKIMVSNTVILILVLFFAGLTCYAQEDTEKNRKEPVVLAVKTIEGEVSGINKDGIAVIYNQDMNKGVEEEIFLPLDSAVRIVHKRSLSEISVGDIVNIQYEEIEEEKDQELKKTFKGKTVTFVKPAVKKTESFLVPEEEAGTDE